MSVQEGLNHLYDIVGAQEAEKAQDEKAIELVKQKEIEKLSSELDSAKSLKDRLRIAQALSDIKNG
jgi:hypothetical protein